MTLHHTWSLRLTKHDGDYAPPIDRARSVQNSSQIPIRAPLRHPAFPRGNAMPTQCTVYQVLRRFEDTVESRLRQPTGARICDIRIRDRGPPSHTFRSVELSGHDI